MSTVVSGALAPSRRYPVRVYFHTADPQSLIDAGFDSIRVEKRKDKDHEWKPVTLPSVGELDLAPARYNYNYTDARAERGNEYRAVLTNSEDPSDPAEVPQPATPGVSVAYEQVMTIRELKERYLWGQDAAFISDDGMSQPDYAFAAEIVRAIARVENALDLKLMRELRVERRDWNPSEQQKGFMLFRTERRPIQSVESVELMLPGQTPFAFPVDWILANQDAGHITVTPQGPVTVPSLGQGWPYANTRYVPGGIRVTYWAGFDPPVPADILSVVGKEAAQGPLNVGGDLVAGAGLAGTSLSMDGLSQSVTTTNSSTNAGFGARLLQYKSELKIEYKALLQRYRGPRMTSA